MYVLYQLSARVLQVKNDWRPSRVDEERPLVFRRHLGVEISSLLRQDVLFLQDLVPLRRCPITAAQVIVLLLLLKALRHLGPSELERLLDPSYPVFEGDVRTFPFLLVQAPQWD